MMMEFNAKAVVLSMGIKLAYFCCAFAVVGAVSAGSAMAQADNRPGSAPAQTPAPTNSPPDSNAQGASAWMNLPTMTVERVFRGPLRDTVVQRLRDPVDGSVCFIYLPMSAAIAAQGQHLIYGPNSIGSLSCFPPANVIQIQPAPSAASAAPASAAPGGGRSR